jgi:hypothetical protein
VSTASRAVTAAGGVGQHLDAEPADRLEDAALGRARHAAHGDGDQRGLCGLDHGLEERGSRQAAGAEEEARGELLPRDHECIG